MHRSKIFTVPPFPSDSLAADLIPRMLQVVNDVEPLPNNRIKQTTLVLDSIMDARECREFATLDGDEMYDRAWRIFGNLGLVDAKRLLDKEWLLNGRAWFSGIVLFPGTILRVSSNLRGAEFVPVITHTETLWEHRRDVYSVERYSAKDPTLVLGYMCLETRFGGHSYVLRPPYDRR